jgi:DNA repair ATPase RecN
MSPIARADAVALAQMRNQIQQLAQMANAALHQPPTDIRNIMQDLAEKLTELSASPEGSAFDSTLVKCGDRVAEHCDEIKATLQGAHAIMESLSAIERRVGPIGSHARGYTHKLTAALRHLEALRAYQFPSSKDAGSTPVEVAELVAMVSDYANACRQDGGLHWGMLKEVEISLRTAIDAAKSNVKD